MAIDHLTRSCTVVLHDDSVSTEDVLCGTKVLPTGILARLSSDGAQPLYILAKNHARNTEEVSVHTSLAQRFGFQNRTSATICVLEDETTASATHVEFFFRDHHLSRADMWRMAASLDRTVVYQGQKIRYLGTAVAEIRAVYISGQEVHSAFAVRGKTKPIYRSGSARYTFLIQISKEMLEYWVRGDLMYERVVTGFLPELFQRWERLKVRHQISVILFGRSCNCDEKEDFFHVLASDVSSNNWHQLLRLLKQTFNGPVIPRQVSLAADGNLVEAMHMAAMDFAKDNVDPHLSGRGTSIIAITAGAGLFHTTHDMLKNTTHLLVGNSIGVDIVALSPKPLHPVPLFSYMRNGGCEYALPHWVDISFYTGPDVDLVPTWLMPEAVDDVIDIALPFLDTSNSNGSVSATSFMAHFDAGIFEEHELDLDTTQKHERPDDVIAKGRSGSASTVTVLEQQTPAHLSMTGLSSEPANAPVATTAPKRAIKAAPSPHALMVTNRKISLGPKGLAPSRGLASTTVSVEHAQQDKETPISSSFTPDGASSGIARQIRQSLARKPSQQSLVSVPSISATESSRPINIQHSNGHTIISETPSDPASLIERKILDAGSGSGHHGSAGHSSGTPKTQKDIFYAAMKAAEQEGNWNASPWLTLLNASNPTRENMRVAAQYRKWQHVFPRAISSADFKWTSMCSPAALPLSTEYKPSSRELEKHFSRKVRRLVAATGNDSQWNGASQIKDQLIKLRLAHGFQIAFAGNGHDLHDGSERVLMSRGNVHHEFRCLSSAELQIVEYTLSSDDSSTSAATDDGKSYKARLRASASSQQPIVHIKMSTERTEPDWSKLDDQVVAHDPLHTELHSSRMRLVLLPVDLPRPGHITPGPSRGLSDEERRIDGIQKLTQLWQRNRYFKPDEERRQATFVRPKATPIVSARDPNPLAIDYETRDPSAVINAHGFSLLTHETESTAPLFPESELYHTSKFDVAKLVKQMQESPPHGVEVRDRRWFARLHFKCFRGDEMVNWLLRVFKDLKTREDAIRLGNDLMDRGIFSHVRAKHEFRDGNYFYQISSAHRTTEYPDNANMFGRLSLRSMPSTPFVEHNNSPMMRPLLEDADSSGKPTPVMAPVEKKEILLSQHMLYDVNSLKRSDQLEIISLHYDRIHNPENCYHIQLEWVNTTALCIRDAIIRWSALVEPYGLKLVQVPLVEASRQHHDHPFDHPIKVRLARRPPDKVLATPVLDAQLLSPRLRPPGDDPISYQKALLRKLGFVLDLEAAASFSSKLDVRYSWGRPEYDMTQFVHKSGLLLAQVAGDETCDFLLLPNRLATASSRPSTVIRQIETELVEDIVERVVSFCQDEAALKSFYDEVEKPRLAPPSPFPGGLGGHLDSDIPPISLPPRLAHRSVMKNIQ